MINDDCNLTCEYCYQGFTNTHQGLDKSYKLMDRIIGFVRYLDDENTVVSIEGGEPTLHLELLEYFMKNIDGIKYRHITLVTNMTYGDNIASLISQFPNHRIVLNPSIHYTQVTPKVLSRIYKNILRFKDIILYVRLMMWYHVKTPPSSFKTFIKVLESLDIRYGVTPVMNIETTTKYDKEGFPYKGDEEMIINGEKYNCNEIYKDKYTTKGMVCENVGCYFFQINGDIALFNCVNNRDIKNIHTNSYEDIWNMDLRTICNLDHCSTCEFYDRREMSEKDFDLLEYNEYKLSEHLRLSVDDDYDPLTDEKTGLTDFHITKF